MSATIRTTAWKPTMVRRVIRVIKSSTCPIECELDDGAHAFVKVLGNAEGPSALACEYVGTEAARLLGLPTFDVAVPVFPDELCTQLEHGLVPQRGPCFATRALQGITWDGGGELLDALENPEDVIGLVVLDTWLRNPDRYFVKAGTTRKNLRNVFLREDGVPRGTFRLMAIDHTHTIRQDRELTTQNLTIHCEREAVIYGLFPEFANHIDREDLEPFVERLRHLAKTGDLDGVVHGTPKQWLPDGQVRQDLPGFLKRRASHVADSIETWLAADCKWAPSPASDP